MLRNSDPKQKKAEEKEETDTLEFGECLTSCHASKTTPKLFNSTRRIPELKVKILGTIIKHSTE